MKQNIKQTKIQQNQKSYTVGINIKINDFNYVNHNIHYFFLKSASFFNQNSNQNNRILQQKRHFLKFETILRDQNHSLIYIKLIIVLVLLLQGINGYMISQPGGNLSGANFYFKGNKGLQQLWIWNDNIINIYNSSNLSSPIYTNTSNLTSPPIEIAISDDENVIASVGKNSFIIEVSIIFFDPVANKLSTAICNLISLNVPSTIGFMDNNNQVVVGYTNFAYQFFTVNIIAGVPTISGNLPKLNFYSMSKMRKNVISKRLYYLYGNGSIGYFNTNQTDPSYKSITSIILPFGNSYNFLFLSTGQLLRYDTNFLTVPQSTIIKIFIYNVFLNTYTLIGSQTHPGLVSSFLEYDRTLTITDVVGNIRQFDLQNVSRGILTEINILSPSVSQLATGLTADLIDSQRPNRVLKSIDNVTGLITPYTLVFSQNNYIKLILKGNSDCLNESNNQYCSTCNLLLNALQCISCNSGFILNITSMTQSCSLPSVTIRPSNSSCSLGMYFNPITKQCEKISCSDENCSICLTNSQICNSCKQGIGVILIQGKCIAVQIMLIVVQISQTTASPLSIPGLRFYLTPLQPFFVFLDDFWYYIYHNRNYSISVKLIFNSIKMINSLKITPQFLDFSSVEDTFNITKTLLVNNYIAYTPFTYYQEQQQDVQFLINTHDMYTWNYITGLITFIIFRVIHKTFQKCVKAEDGILGTIKKYILENSLYKCLFLVFIQGNLIFISFCAAMQLREPSTLTFYDRCNIIFAIFYLFVAMIFSFCFYILIHSLCLKQQAEIFLTYTHGKLSSFLCQTIQIGLKNFISGFIHAYLIFNYKVQIISLIALRMFLIVSVLIFRKKYLNKGIFFSFLIYFTGGFILDIILLCDNENATELTPLALSEVIVIGVISLSSILNVFSVFFQPVRQFYFYLKNIKSNSVQPDQVKNQKDLKDQKTQKIKSKEVAFKDFSNLSTKPNLLTKNNKQKKLLNSLRIKKTRNNLNNLDHDVQEIYLQNKQSFENNQSSIQFDKKARILGIPNIIQSKAKKLESNEKVIKNQRNKQYLTKKRIRMDPQTKLRQIDKKYE